MPESNTITITVSGAGVPVLSLPSSSLPSSSAGLVYQTFSGSGFDPSTLIHVGYAPIPPYTNDIIDVTSDANGNWSLQFPMPWSAGTYTIVAQEMNNGIAGLAATGNLIIT